MRRAVTDYRVGVSDPHHGFGDGLSDEAQQAWRRFGKLAWECGRESLSDLLGWSPGITTTHHDALFTYGFFWRSPPSLRTFAIAQIVAAMEDDSPMKVCQLAECGRPFLRPEARGQSDERKYLRSDAKFHSTKCAKRDAYLRAKREEDDERTRHRAPSRSLADRRQRRVRRPTASVARSRRRCPRAEA